MNFGIYEGTENYFDDPACPVNAFFTSPETYHEAPQGGESIDDLMNRQVTSAIATELLGMKSEELDEMITDKIHKAELVGSDNERVVIPVFTTA